jgi:solute carrier family 25 (mitochondrial carnitine/acylcarnitine transporter), member 20/29
MNEPLNTLPNSLETARPARPATSASWQYYFKGAIAGMTGILLSHPIDTVKTHIQTGNALRDFTPGLRNLYRGLLPPLVGVGLEKAIVFGTYNYALRKTDNIPLSGGIAGFTAAVIVSPFERLKILKQNKIPIARQELTARFLFQGLSATFTREVPGFAIYFSIYQSLKYQFHSKEGAEIGLVNSFFYGGISGVAAWIFIYPQDRIKTILQSSGNASSGGGIKNIVQDIYNKGGLRHFYKGFSWAVARAMLLHSGTFCMMEYLSRQF